MGVGGTFKLSDYGIPPRKQSILLMTETELLAITDILREITTNPDTLKHIEELEKPFKKNLNSGSNKGIDDV